MQPHPWRYRWVGGWMGGQILFVVLLQAVSHKNINSMVFYNSIFCIKIKYILDKSRFSS